MGAGKMCLVRLMHLGASASSKIGNSYQINPSASDQALFLLPYSHHPSLTQSQEIPALNVTDVAAIVCLLFLRIIALLTLTVINSNLSPDSDLDRYLIPDLVFNIYLNLNCTKCT